MTAPIRWTARARRLGHRAAWAAIITAGAATWLGPILYVTLHP